MADVDYNALFMQSGMMPAPPYSPPIGYEGMTPNERAALRLRPQGGVYERQPQATPGEMLQAGAMLVPGAGPLAVKAIGAVAPRAVSLAGGLTAGGLGFPALTYSTNQAGANEPDQVKQLQMQLRDAGFYAGPIDGRVGPGTARAKSAFDQAERQRIQQEQEAARTEATTRAAEAQAETARLQREQIEAKRQGGERLKEMEGDVPWYRQALRDYGAPVGYGLGAILGTAARAGVAGASNAASKRTAQAAEGMMEGTVRSMPGRVARMNEFWRRGGAGAEVPFTSTPGAAPGFAVNPTAVPISGLYQPNRVANAAADLGVTGAFGLESGYAQFVLAPKAREELSAAQEAASQDPSEVNLRRLQAAKDNFAIAETLTNLGRGAAGGYLGSSLKIQRKTTTPAMDKAEAERLKLEDYLRRRAKK